MPRFSVRSILLTIAFLFLITPMHELTRFSGPETLEAAAQAKAPASALLPFKRRTTLPNGLKVIVVPTGFPNIVSIQIPSRPARATRSSRASRASRISSST